VLNVPSSGRDISAGQETSLEPGVSGSWIEAVVVHWEMATPRVVVLDLQPADGGLFPEYEAGAHVDVLVHRADSGGAVVRQYSLCGTPGDRKQYRIAVLRDEQSRGGSVAMHGLQVGHYLRISAPRNNFRLAAVSHHRLFAGGIGITPLLAMARQLDASGGEYTLHYCARTATDVSFAPLFKEHPRVTVHLDDGPHERKLDLRRDLGRPEPDAAVYVCGPGPFIDYVLAEATALGWPAQSLHKERFTPTAAPAEPGEAFTVRLASSGAEYPVSPDETILDVLARNGVEASFSCQQGICGECIVKVLAGQPDHRDDVLSDDERANGLFTPCCSRASTPVIELDL
jgi:vanillate monooxygenase ferredoxin subunit